MSKKKSGSSEQEEQWLPIVEILKKENDFSWTVSKEIKLLVKFISDEHETYIYTADDTSQHLLIMVPPYGELGSAMQSENTWKFLVSLEVGKVISDLYLPVRMREQNQEVVEFRKGSMYFDAAGVLSEALRNFENFKTKVASFKLLDWEKFKKVRDKVNSSRQSLVLEEGDGNAIVLDPIDLDVALAELSETALKHKESPHGWIKGDVSLGLMGEQMKDEESRRKLSIVNYLQAQEVISKYEIVKRDDMIFVKKPDEETQEIPCPTFVARCDFQPETLLEFTKQIWEPKKQFAQQVSELYFRMIKLIESYFENPAILDAKLNSLYLQLDKKINELLRQDHIPFLYRQYRMPFFNLFAAQKELEATKTTAQSEINAMYSFYGLIQNSISNYTLEEKQDVVAELDNVLAEIKEQKLRDQQSDVVKKDAKKKTILQRIASYTSYYLKQVSAVCDVFLYQMELEKMHDHFTLRSRLKISKDVLERNNLSVAEAEKIAAAILEVTGENLFIIESQAYKALVKNSKIPGSDGLYFAPQLLQWEGMSMDELKDNLVLTLKSDNIETAESLRLLKQVIADRLQDLSQHAIDKQELPSGPTRLQIFISPDDGIYQDKTTKNPNYPIKKKRAKLIWNLKDEKLSGSQLAGILGQTVGLVSKEIDEINDTFKTKLNLPDDLIVHANTGGYKLNKEKYAVEFIT